MNYTMFLPVGISNEEGTLYFILRDDLNREIIELLIRNEHIPKADVYKILEVNRGKIYYRIKKLNEMGIISASSNSEKCIILNSEKKILLMELINKISGHRMTEERHMLISLYT
jgi:predicted transcriptional regulator